MDHIKKLKQTYIEVFGRLSQVYLKNELLSRLSKAMEGLVKDNNLKECVEGNIVGQDDDCRAQSNSEVLSDKDIEGRDIITQGESKSSTNCVNQGTTSPDGHANESTIPLDRDETSGRETRRKRHWKKSESSEDEDYVQRTVKIRRLCYRYWYDVC